MELAANSSLVVIVPHLVVESLGGDHAIAPLPVTIPFDPFAYPCIIHTRGRALGPATQLLIELVQQRFSHAPRNPDTETGARLAAPERGRRPAARARASR
jgi:hypothetical protein